VAGTILRQGIASILQNTPYKLVASAATPRELAHLRYADGRSTLAIVAAEERNGKLNETAESVRLLRSSLPNGKVVLILETDGTIDLPRVMALSPDGCIMNLGSGDFLLKVLELVLMDQQVFAMCRSMAMTASESTTRTAGDNAPKKVVCESYDSNTSLSPRERQILISLAEGKSNKAIARQYNLSEATVKVHLKAVLRKLGKHNRTQAAIWAIEHGLRDHHSEESIVPDAPSLHRAKMNGFGERVIPALTDHLEDEAGDRAGNSD
jgi:two-component system nitrate/nitrite response regulator NarL